MFQLVNTNMLLPVSQKGLRWAGAAGGARQVLKLGTHLKYPKVPSLPAFHIVPWGEVKPALWPTEMIPWNRTILIHPDSCGISCRLIVVYQTRVDSKNSLSCSAELIKGPCLGPISEKKTAGEVCSEKWDATFGERDMYVTFITYCLFTCRSVILSAGDMHLLRMARSHPMVILYSLRPFRRCYNGIERGMGLK